MRPLEKRGAILHSGKVEASCHERNVFAVASQPLERGQSFLGCVLDYHPVFGAVAPEQ